MCEKCGELSHKPIGTLQSLGLKALSLYETPYITQGSFASSFTSLVGNASGDIGNVAIQIPGVFPRHLHQQPGISVNAYALLKDPVVTCTVVGALVALPQFAGVLYYRDLSNADHVLCGVTIENVVAGKLNVIAGGSATIVVAPQPFTSGQPIDLGDLVLKGAFTLASATSVTFSVAINVGFLYGVPR